MTRSAVLFWFVLVVQAAAYAAAQTRGSVMVPMAGEARGPRALSTSATLAAARRAGAPIRRGVPATLHVDGYLRELVERMWEQSSTFRRQCARLAQASVPVTVAAALPTRSKRVGAWTRMERSGGRLVQAHVHIGIRHAPNQRVELIAHEMEHILEQLDDVDLDAQVRLKVAKRTPSGHYETKRAVEAGRRVAREVQNDRSAAR